MSLIEEPFFYKKAPQFVFRHYFYVHFSRLRIKKVTSNFH